MANLFKTVKRLERERYFAHIDFAQPWGKKKGFDRRGTVHADRCPDLRVATAPPRWAFCIRCSGYNHGAVWYGQFKQDAEKLLAAYRADYPTVRFWLTEYHVASNKVAALLPEPVAASLPIHTPVNFERLQIKPRSRWYVGTDLPDHDYGEASKPDFSGDATIQLAPRECTGSAIATSVSAQLVLDLVMTPKLMFRSSWQWPKVIFDAPVPIPSLVGVQMRLAL